MIPISFPGLSTNMVQNKMAVDKKLPLLTKQYGCIVPVFFVQHMSANTNVCVLLLLYVHS